MASWVTKAWEALPTELIINSFKCCGLTIDVSGDEDNLIHCLKEGEPCRPAWQMLQNFRTESYEELEQIIEDDDEQLELNEIVVDEDDDLLVSDDVIWTDSE